MLRLFFIFCKYERRRTLLSQLENSCTNPSGKISCLSTYHTADCSAGRGRYSYTIALTKSNLCLGLFVEIHGNYDYHRATAMLFSSPRVCECPKEQLVKERWGVTLAKTEDMICIFRNVAKIDSFSCSAQSVQDTDKRTRRYHYPRPKYKPST
jgi:hypothetical protein